MFKKSIPLITLIIVICFVSLISFVSQGLSEQKKTCIECHTIITKNHKYIHPAVKMGCESCHVRNLGKEHPREKDSITLKSSLTDLCLGCHKKENFIGKYVHKPLEDGMCRSCHNVHYSKYEHLLGNKTPDLCYVCHNKDKFNKKNIHKVAMGSCGMKCHDPHTSKNPKLLSMSIKDICVGCHKKQESGIHIMSLPGGKEHPVFWRQDPKNRKQEMTCTSCHDPHSSKYDKLFTYKNICKRCHQSY
jgi:predicted CXXCH cytochrome family protein